jgi:hypothetical protein
VTGKPSDDGGEPKPQMSEEEYVNVRMRAEMSFEAYTIVAYALAEFGINNPEHNALLHTIKFTRTA